MPIHQHYGTIAREARRRGVPRHVIVAEMYRKQGKCVRCGGPKHRRRKDKRLCDRCLVVMNERSKRRYHRLMRAAGVRAKRKRCGVCGKLGHNSRSHERAGV